jgi:hypothetical protein
MRVVVSAFACAREETLRARALQQILVDAITVICSIAN